MRRVVVLVLALVLLPASAAAAAELDELLDESRDASFRAEQVITCSTPDGVRDAVIELNQSGGVLHVGETRKTLAPRASAVAFSSDGERVAIGDQTGAVSIFPVR